MKGEISKGFASLPGLSTQAKYLMSLTLLVGISVDVSKSKQPKPTNRPTRSSNNTPDTYWEDTDSTYHRYSHITVHCSTIYNGDIVEPMCSQSEKWTWRTQWIYTMESFAVMKLCHLWMLACLSFRMFALCNRSWVLALSWD